MNSDQYVLLVEDDLDISNAIESILTEEGFKIKCTFNGKEAIDFLNSTEKLPALILLDIMMPLMNGYEFREAQLKDTKISKIPTVVLSAAGRQDESRKLGCKESLNKPLDLEILIEAVKRNLAPL